MAADKHTVWHVVLRVLLVAYAVTIVIVAGILTNWFRYAPSLEATYVLGILLATAFVVAVVSFLVARHMSTPTGVFIILVVAAGSFGLTTWAYQHAYGTLIPRPELQHLEKNGDQMLRLGNRTLIYHIELINPYSAGRTVLVIQEDGMSRKIEIPLFSGAVAAYVPADAPSDWASLQPTSTANVVQLRTSHHLREATFHIDLSSGAVREIEQ